jgi:hypothetical protein
VPWHSSWDEAFIEIRKHFPAYTENYKGQDTFLGNPAFSISREPLAFRPHLAMGLAFSTKMYFMAAY